MEKNLFLGAIRSRNSSVLQSLLRYGDLLRPYSLTLEKDYPDEWQVHSAKLSKQ